MTTMKHTAKEKVRARRRARGAPFARLCALGMALCMALSLLPVRALAAEDTEAAAIRLRETQGAVRVRNASAAEQSIRSDMRIYNGWRVQTDARSYAWLSLDDSKAVKLDQVSEAEVRKNGKMLDLLLNAGNLYFSVDKPLEDDESLNIRTSTIVMGVRGTAGWVRHVNSRHTQVYILEGTVQCTVTDPDSGVTKTARIDAGEMADLHVNGAEAGDEKDEAEIEKSVFRTGDIDGFVLTELAGDDRLIEKIYEATETDIDLRALTPEEAQTRQSEKEDAVSQRLSVLSAAEARQERGVSKDPVWEAAGGGAGQAVPIRPHSDSPSYRTTASTSSGSVSPAPAPVSHTVYAALENGTLTMYAAPPAGFTLSRADTRQADAADADALSAGALPAVTARSVYAAPRTWAAAGGSGAWQLAETYSRDAPPPWSGASLEKVVFAEEIHPTSTAYWFYNCKLVTIEGMENLKTESVTDMRSMFEGCAGQPHDYPTYKLYDEIPEPDQVEGMELVDDEYVQKHGWIPSFGFQYIYVKHNYRNVFSLNLSGLDTSTVTNMSRMFYGCSELTNLNLDGLDTSRVTDMSEMFSGCSGVYWLGLSSFNTSNVMDMSRMFYGCSGLEMIYGSETFSTGAVRASTDMFTGCVFLSGDQRTTFNGEHTDASYARLDGGKSAPGYFINTAAFTASQNVTRAWAAVQIAEALGIDSILYPAGFARYSDMMQLSDREKNAINVLTDLGLMAGDENGFRPGDSINHSEAARILACVLWSRDHADSLSGSSFEISYRDVPASHWASGYIYALKAEGVLPGRDWIDPDGPVTQFTFTSWLDRTVARMDRNRFAIVDASDQSDEFQRPCKRLVADGKTVVVTVAAPVLHYTSTVTLGQIYRDLGLTQTTYVTSDGTAGGASLYFIDGLDAGGQAVALTDGSNQKIGGMGTETYVYYSGGTVRICEINWYVGDVTGVYAENETNPAYIDIAGRGVEIENGTIAQDSGAVTSKNTSGTKEISGFSVDDVIIYTCSWKDKTNGVQDSPDIVEIRKAEIITGELSAFVTIGREATVNGRSASGSVYIGQNKYYYSAKVANTPDITALMSFPVAELDVVLDKYGYAIDVGEILNYAVVVKVGLSGAFRESAMVNLLLTNGKTTGAVELSTKNSAHTVVGNTIYYGDGVTPVSEGDIVTCAGVTADGKYTLEYKRARISNNPPSYGFDTTGLIGEKLITNGASQLLLSAFGPDAVGHAGDKTIFLLKGPNGNYKSYKGVREVPTVEIIGADILTINSWAEKSATAQLVYVDAGTDSVKIHSSDFDGEEVFVDQGYAVVVNAGIGGTFGDAPMVNLLLTDGTVTGAVELSTKNSAHFAPVGSNTIYYGDGVTPVSEGDIVTCANNAGGMYILTFKSAKASNNPPYTGFDTTGLIGQKLIATGESQLLLSAFGAGSAGRADSKTVFLIRDASGEYNPYKGVSKAPTVEITGAGVLTINSYAENSTAAQLVYVDVGENGAASIQPAGDSFDVGEDVFVKFPAAAAKTVSTNGYYYELPAWVNGVARTIHLNGSQGDAAYADGSAAEYRLYSSMTTDSDDITTLGDESRPVFGSTEYNNGDIGLGGTWYSLADSCSVFLLTGGDLSESTIEAIPTSGATKLWFNTDSGGNASCIIWTTDVSPTFTADDQTASGLSWEDFIAAKLADVPIGGSLNIVSDAVTLTNDLTIPTGKRVVISGDVYVNSTGDGETLLTVNGALQAGSLTIGASDAAGAATTVTMNVSGSATYPASVVTTNNIVVKTDGHVNVSTDGTLYAWNQSGAGNVISGNSLDILGLTSDVTFSGKTVLKGLLTILAGNLSFGSGLEIDDSAAAGTARLTIGQTGGADRINVDVRGGVSARTDNTDSANLIEVLSTGDGDGSVSLGSGAGLAIAGGGTADPVVSLGTVSGEGSLQNESANTTAETVVLPAGSVTGIRIPGSGGRLNIRVPVYAEGKAVDTGSADVTGTVYRIDGDTAILQLTFQSTEAPAAAGGYAAENFLVLAVTRAEDGKVYLTIRRNQS